MCSPRKRLGDNMSSDAYWKNQEGVGNIEKQEAAGKVADSLDVRVELLKRVERGEITIEQAQAELAAIKRNANKNGKITRHQAYNGQTPRH